MSQVESVISVKDLFAELIRKLWLIIICIIVFAVALGGYKYVQSVQSQKNEETTIEELSEEDEEAVLEYVAKVQAYESAKEYCENSILFTFNPYNVYQTELQYIIGGDVAEDDLPTVRAGYADYVLFGRLASDIAENNEEYDATALKDIISTDSYIREQDPSLKTVRIMIYAKDEEQNEELVSAVKEQMEAYSKEIKETIGAHEFTLLDENTISVIRTDATNNKNTYENSRDALEEEVKSLESQLSTIQLSYAREVLGEEVIEDIESNEQGISMKSILKYAILGGVLGCILAICIIAVLYIFSGSVKTVDETGVVFGIRKLAALSVKEKNWCEKFSNKLFYRNSINPSEVETDILFAKLNDLCASEAIKEIVFVGETEAEATKQISALIDKLKKHNILVKRVSNITNNPEDFSVSSKSGNVVLVETLGKSKSKTIFDTMKVCKECDIDVLGYIVFD